MDSPDLLRPGQIGDRAGNPKHPVKAPRREPHSRRRIRQKLAPGIVRRRYRLKNLAVCLCIRPHTRAIVAIGLHLPRGRYPSGNLQTTFCRWRKRQIGRRHALHLNVQIDAVEQRT